MILSRFKRYGKMEHKTSAKKFRFFLFLLSTNRYEYNSLVFEVGKLAKYNIPLNLFPVGVDSASFLMLKQLTLMTLMSLVTSRSYTRTICSVG